MTTETRTCFVIGPIGPDETKIRDDADWVFHLVEEALAQDEKCRWETQRADKIDRPGMITDQIIRAVLDSDLVIADLCGHNANAFYELALRHMSQKPVVHLIPKGENIPFDVGSFRTVFYSIKNPSIYKESVDEIYSKSMSIVYSKEPVSNPVTQAIGIENVKNIPIGDNIEKLLKNIISSNFDIIQRIEYLESKDETMQLREIYGEGLTNETPSERKDRIKDEVFKKKALMAKLLKDNYKL